jgi:hypothetical protein
MRAVFFLIFLIAGATQTLGQAPNDAGEVNPKECGLAFASQVQSINQSPQTNLPKHTQQRQRIKRFLNAEPQSDSMDWGWLVLLMSESIPNNKTNMTFTTQVTFAGSLINSQWAITRARSAE